MIFPKKCLRCPPFLGYICWPKVVGAFLLLSTPLSYFLSGIPVLKVHKLERKCNQNGEICFNFFKIADDKEPFHVQWYRGENAVICGHDKTSDSDSQCPNCKEEYKEKNSYVAPCANVGFVRNAFMNNQS